MGPRPGILEGLRNMFITYLSWFMEHPLKKSKIIKLLAPETNSEKNQTFVRCVDRKGKRGS